MQAMASMTRATTSERRMARNALFTDKASVVLPEEAMDALLLIPAVSISRNFCKMSDAGIKLLKATGIQSKQNSGYVLFSTHSLSRILSKSKKFDLPLKGAEPDQIE